MEKSNVRLEINADGYLFQAVKETVKNGEVKVHPLTLTTDMCEAVATALCSAFLYEQKLNKKLDKIPAEPYAVATITRSDHTIAWKVLPIQKRKYSNRLGEEMDVLGVTGAHLWVGVARISTALNSHD